jgi:hypothetical protein
MRALLATLLLGWSLAAFGGCETVGSDDGAGSGVYCAPCLKDADCPGGRCGQFGGDSYCAPECNGGACAEDRACTALNTAEGKQASLCVPRVAACAPMSGATSGAGGMSQTCGALDGPTVKACCHSCGNKPCQANGCYGGWWCNRDTCSCQSPPDPASCTPTTAASSSVSTGVGGGGPSGIGPTGGKLDVLSFAVVGDTRPPTEDDLAGYPTAVITKIWQNVNAQQPTPAFALTTGDYVYAKPFGTTTSTQQFNLYLGARAKFINAVFPALGNHECTGATASNCGTANKDGNTINYVNFLKLMLGSGQIGGGKPYYTIPIDHTGGKWTAKFVFVAANAWDSGQATWLEAELAKPTTYTFVVRHEASYITEAPGVAPSSAIIAKHPLTLLIVGHTHTFQYLAASKQMIVGNGGAPLTGSVNYGYVVMRQRPDLVIEIREYDYATNALGYAVAIKPDGTTTK